MCLFQMKFHWIYQVNAISKFCKMKSIYPGRTTHIENRCGRRSEVTGKNRLCTNAFEFTNISGQAVRFLTIQIVLFDFLGNGLHLLFLQSCDKR